MTDDVLIGQQFDEYRLESLLGHGGMARVYRAVDVRLKRYVAIKVIDTPFQDESDYAARFEREAQSIAQLNHPNIVTLYRYGKANDLLYMAMEYVEGSDLYTVLSNYRADEEFIEVEDARRIVREICLALDYAHGQGVIHRDIKPSNIMLDKTGRAILTDFGLALLTEVGTLGEIFGSPRYIAPEQAISSAGAVPQSDLYAVGVILYRMFTGEVPFNAPEPLDIAMLHMSEPPRPPRELRSDISPELEAVILKALAKKPEERYPTGVELVDALDAVLQKGITQVSKSTTVFDRVALELEAHPLPPIPAAVAASTPSSTQPKPVMAPAPEPLASTPKPVKPVTVSAPEQPASTPKSARIERWQLYLAAVAVVMTAVVLIILILLIGRGDGGVGEPAAIIIASTATETPLPTLTDTPVPTETSVPTLTDTPIPTDTSLPTMTHTPVPTNTPVPTMTHTPVPTDTPSAATPAIYKLLFRMRGRDSLFVINIGETAIPLTQLHLGNIDGNEWGIAALGARECVTVWNNPNDTDKAPENVECIWVGESLERKGRERFWNGEFTVYFDGGEAGICDGDPCELWFDNQLNYIPLPTPTPIPTVELETSYPLTIWTRGGDSLFVFNGAADTGEFELPLAQLQLGDGDGAVLGGEWGIVTLGAGECVTVWNNPDDTEKAPENVECRQVGEHLERKGRERFWHDQAFNVYYNGVQIVTCADNDDEPCLFDIGD